MRSKIHPNNNGFTLIEILVSLVLFSVGMLGIALQFSDGIKSRINTEVHASIPQITAQAIEPLNNALLINFDSFKTALTALYLRGPAPGSADAVYAPAFEDVTGSVFNTNNSNLENFAVTVSQAVDVNGTQIIDMPGIVASGDQPPFTVVLEITQTRPDGESLVFYSTHVFVP